MNRLAYHDAIGRNRRGLVASPTSGLGQPTPTGSRVCDNTTLRSSGARGLDVSRCYRHIAPLERKAPMHQNSRCVMHRRGGVASLDGLGNPTPTGSMVCDNTILRSSGARGLDVSRCYRHIAPLERKAPTHQNSRCVMHRRGGVASPDGLGAANDNTGPTVSDNTTLRSSGARGLDVSRCYRHIAPLERKAPMHQNSRCVMHRRGEVSSPSGLGQPTLYGFNGVRQYHIALLWSERQNRITLPRRIRINP